MTVYDDLLVADLSECFAQLRQYDDNLRRTVEFGFGAVVTVLGASAWLVAQYHLTTFIATVIAILLFLSAIAGALLLMTLARNRVYFVTVARYINEIRAAYLVERPAQVANLAGMYTSYQYPRTFHPGSTHTLSIVFFSLSDALLFSLGYGALRAAISLGRNVSPTVPWSACVVIFVLTLFVENAGIFYYWSEVSKSDQ